MRIQKKKASMILIIATVALLIVGSIAFFTDRISSSATATAGTLDLMLSTVTKSHSDALKPGQGVQINFPLSNRGNKSADVRETIVLKSAVALNTSTPEFVLYRAKDVTINGSEVTPKSGAQPIAVSSWANGNKDLTFKLHAAEDVFILNGTGTGAETETSAKGTSYTSSYVLVFGNNADNTFMNKSVTLHYLAEAKQHRNTGHDTWQNIITEQIAFAGNNNYMSVPGLS